LVPDHCVGRSLNNVVREREKRRRDREAERLGSSKIDDEHGIFVVYADMGGWPVAINPFDLIVKRIVVKGFFLNHPDIEPKIHAALRETVSLVASGAIQVPIAATNPLSSLREAARPAGGKVLLDLRGTT
jgi:NADPH:quinone reductase-like Zn-dependent oxidoreductase